jgi:putative ABC transport system permease protein
LVAELTLVAVAVMGALLLRRRGLGTQVDVYLVALPVLVAAAAAVMALRVLPYPLRLVAAVASRGRGAVPFLGLARAGRSAPATAGPVAVLVVAVSVGTFCAAVSSSVSVARDRVAELAVLGDAFVQGGRFSWSAADELAAVPGVTAVAPMTIAHNSLVGGGRITQAETGVSVVIVDAPALEHVLQASGSSQHVPDALLAATGGSGPAPAVVSPDIAVALAGSAPESTPGTTEPGGATVQGRAMAFTVAGVAETFPGLGVGNDRFVAVPLQALPRGDADRLYPNAFAIAGPAADPQALAAVGDASQRASLSEALRRPFEGQLSLPTRVRTYEEARADLERGGVDRVLGFTFVTGLAAGLLLALLAVGFAVATGARGRGQALSRLRTMGLGPGQGRRLIAYELMPLILLGAVVGSAVGAALPLLLGPALGLSAFSDGGDVVFELDPRVPGFALAMALAGILLAMAVEASMNRRARLGEVLRVGEGT